MRLAPAPSVVNVTDAVRAGVGALVRAPGTVLPLYLLGLGAGAATRVPLLVALGATVVHLADAGRLAPVATELRGFDPSTIPPDAGPEAVPDGLVTAVEGLATPTAIGLLSVGIGLAAVVRLLARSVTAAGTLHAGHAFVRGSDPAAVGVAGIGADWWTFLGLRLVRVAVLGGALVTVAGLAAVSPVAGALALFGAVVVVPLVLLGLAFAGQAAVVDRVGAATAIRRSFAFPLSNPGGFAGFLAVATVAWGAAVAAAGVLAAAGVPQVSTLVFALVVPPFLDVTKTGLYLQGEYAPDPTSRVRVTDGLSGGLRALGRFLRDAPLASLAALVVFVGGGAVGYVGTLGFDARLPIPGDRVAELGSLGATGFVNIAANNWGVAAGTAFGGVALGLPTAVSLGFNGVLIGAIAGVTDPRAFLALVAPHGVIEVPAIAIAGGLGFHLAGVGWRSVRGRTSAQEVGAELVFALRVLVGLAVVLVVAAGIEAFVTPRVAARLLAGT
jgi:hypothetical protein